MGTLTFSDAANMASPTIWYGSVYYADDNEIWLYSGTYGGVYLGSNFTYSNGAVIGGTLTSYIQARNVAVDYFGNLTYTEMYRGEGFSLSAQTAYNYIQVARDASGFMRYAMSGADVVVGSAYNDVLAGFNSNDSLDGRGGSDTAIYTGSQNQYSFSKNGNSYVITDSVSNRDGTDTLSNIEFVKFTDKTVAVSDLISQSTSGEVSVAGSGTNSAGKNESVVGSAQIDKFIYTTMASSYQVISSSGRVTVKNISSGEEDSLTNIERIKFTDKSIAFDTAGNAGKAYRVYKAAFARDPQSGDMSGLGFWISRIDNGMDMVEVAARFIDSNEFRSLYGQNPTNSEFLTKVYTNVLGRTPDQGGYSWWLNELNTNPEKTKAKVLADFAESSENQTGVASLIGNGIQYMEIV